MDDRPAPPEAYHAAALAYDAAVNAELHNPPGSALGERARRKLEAHPAFRAAVDMAWRLGVDTGRQEASVAGTKGSDHRLPARDTDSRTDKGIPENPHGLALDRRHRQGVI